MNNHSAISVREYAAKGATGSHGQQAPETNPIHAVSHETRLDNHLRQTLSAQRLATDKVLALQASQGIEEGGDQKHDRRGNQARRAGDKADPLDRTHSEVHSGAHPIRGEASDEVIEFVGRRANAKQEGNFNENKDHAGNPASVSSRSPFPRDEGPTYKHRILKMMRTGGEKMLAIPSAMHRIIQITPVLIDTSQRLRHS